jgi:hypothetical protein
MLDDHTFGFEKPPKDSAVARWCRRNHSALVATAWFWLAFFVLALITLLTGWASLPLTFALQALVSFGAGYLAARLGYKEEPAAANFSRQGARAGFYLPLTSLLVLLVVALWIGIASFGAMLPLMVPFFLSLPLLFLMCTFMGVLGARMAEFILKRKS